MSRFRLTDPVTITIPAWALVPVAAFAAGIVYGIVRALIGWVIA